MYKVPGIMESYSMSCDTPTAAAASKRFSHRLLFADNNISSSSSSSMKRTLSYLQQPSLSMPIPNSHRQEEEEEDAALQRASSCSSGLHTMLSQLSFHSEPPSTTATTNSPPPSRGSRRRSLFLKKKSSSSNSFSGFWNGMFCPSDQGSLSKEDGGGTLTLGNSDDSSSNLSYDGGDDGDEFGLDVHQPKTPPRRLLNSTHPHNPPMTPTNYEGNYEIAYQEGAGASPHRNSVIRHCEKTPPRNHNNHNHNHSNTHRSAKVPTTPTNHEGHFEISYQGASPARNSIQHEMKDQSEVSTESRLPKANTRNSPPPPPTETPLRFLRAAKGDPVEGKRRYQATLAWRKEHGMDTCLQDPHPHFDLIKQHYPHFFYKPGHNGEPVFWEQPPRTNLAALREGGISLPKLLHHYALITEYLWQHVERDDLAKSITVIDLKGMRMSDFVGETVDYVRACSKFTGAHYPERCGTLFVINVPGWFSMIWKIIKPMVDPVTVCLQALFILFYGQLFPFNADILLLFWSCFAAGQNSDCSRQQCLGGAVTKDPKASHSTRIWRIVP